ncbi:DUF397 domain-containing protein [Streptomyces sp. NPDC005438]|uniref:DUF397 domain-containing protein n=1 Tax=Streptomyces sp. NPDC005438 TaxID=3156880 RepID=UPI0033B3D982
MTRVQPPCANHQPNWRTSSYTGSGDNNCVEVADNLPQIMIRDTKYHDTGPILTIPPASWQQFTSAVVDARLGE